MSQWNLDIISAFYGPLNVTDVVRRLYVEKAFADPKLTAFAITPTNTIFKTDPLLNHRKSFVVVYRVKLSVDLDYGQGNQYSFTDLRRAVSEEGQECRINFEPTIASSAFKPPATYTRNVPFIVNASYYTKDVTNIVRQSFDKNPSLIVTNENLGGDPIVNTKKSLVVTWAYVTENGGLVFQAQSAIEGTSITSPFRPPPRLTIRAANYAGISVTDKIQALADANQTVTIDMTRILQICGMTSDPWPNVPKSLNVLYQWEGRSLELLIAADLSGTHRLDPTVSVDPLRKRFFNPQHGRTAGKVNIIALVWGINQGVTSIPGDKFQQIATQRKFTLSNIWFGFDGWLNVPKIGEVFYQYGISGPIRSASAREGTELVLPEPYGVLDPLPAKGLLDLSVQSGLFGFRLKSPHTNAFVRVVNNGLSALARGREDAAVFAIETPAGLSSRLAIYDPDETFVGWASAEPGSALQVKKEAKDAVQVNFEFPARWGGKLCLPSFYRGTAQSPEVFVATEPLTRSQLIATNVDSAYGVFGAGYELEFVSYKTGLHPRASVLGTQAPLAVPADWAPPPTLVKLLVVDPFFIIQNKPLSRLSNIVTPLVAWCNALPSFIKASIAASVAKAKDDPALLPNTAVKLSTDIITLLYKEGHLYDLFQRIWSNLGAEPGFLQGLASSYAVILNAKSPQELGLGALGIFITDELKGTNSAPAARPPTKVEPRVVKAESDDDL